MTLNQLFTDIANAIRAKKGTSTKIVAENFPTEIADINTGNLTDEEYAEANDDLDEILEGTTPITIYPPDWGEIGYEDTPQSIKDAFNYAKEIHDNWDNSITDLNGKFLNDTQLVIMPFVDTSNATLMGAMFKGCSNLIDVSYLDTSKATNVSSMFSGCYRLLNIPQQLDTSNSTSLYSMFDGCSKLVDIPQLDAKNVTDTLNNMFRYCSSLSNESLNNIMATCISATKYTGTKTLKFVGLTQTQATTCQTLSNYNDFIAAGWTTGY